MLLNVSAMLGQDRPNNVENMAFFGIFVKIDQSYFFYFLIMPMPRKLYRPLKIAGDLGEYDFSF